MSPDRIKSNIMAFCLWIPWIPAGNNIDWFESFCFLLAKLFISFTFRALIQSTVFRVVFSVSGFLSELVMLRIITNRSESITGMLKSMTFYFFVGAAILNFLFNLVIAAEGYLAGYRVTSGTFSGLKLSNI